MIELTLPYPPSVNHYKAIGRLRTTKSGKIYQPRYNSPETISFYNEVFVKCKAQGVKSFHSATISVDLYVYPPDARKRDLDGILKVLLDSLQRAGCFNDDYQIARLLVIRKDIIKDGQIIVRISVIP